MIEAVRGDVVRQVHELAAFEQWEGVRERMKLGHKTLS
jgi:hypothetical protein